MKRKCKVYLAFFLVIIATIISISLSIPAYAEVDNGYLIVYVTDSGGKYHSEDCGYLRKSKYSITLEDAIREGYTRCTRCDPPIYTGTIEPIETKEVRSGGSSSQSYSKSSRSNDDKPESMTDLQQNAQHRTTIAEREKTEGIERTIENGNRKSADVLDIVFYSFWGVIAFFIFVVPLLYKLYEVLPWVKRKREREEKEARRIAEEEKKKREQEALEAKRLELQERCKKEKADFSKQIEDLYSKIYVAPESAEALVLEKRKELLRLCIKNDVCIKNGFVCDRTGKYFGERFTVYVSNTGRYHLGKCRYGGDKPVHLLHASKYSVPCSVCKPNMTIDPWMRDCERPHKEIEALNNYLSMFSDETKHRFMVMKARMEVLVAADNGIEQVAFCGTPMLRHQGKD